jgi:hypothetical protein
MAKVIGKQRTWSGSTDAQGHRDYKIKWIVKALTTEGPAAVLLAEGLPRPGTPWQLDDDSDPWAFCKSDMSVDLHEHTEGDPHIWWVVNQRFSTKPDFRCNDSKVDNPLLEPMTVSGGFSKEKREAVRDRHGDLLQSSSFEQFRGQKIEFDCHKPNVKIGQNVHDLQLSLCASMVNHVNQQTMWGLNPRCVKLSNFSWERKQYGQCFVYFKREFDFDADYNTFDRYLLDEGTKALNGEWDKTTTDGAYVIKNIPRYDPIDKKTIIGSLPPDNKNPQHFKRWQDRNGENTRVILNGAGMPAKTKVYKEGGGAVTGGDDPYPIKVEYYEEANFLLLGVPVNLER